MLVIVRNALLIALVISSCAVAQTKWELGIGGGFGLAKDNTVTSAPGSADTGLDNGLIVTAAGGHHTYGRLSGEFRYTYRKGNPMVSAGGSKPTFAGDSHAVNYDFLLHTAPREAKVRPYFAFGGGVKVFRGTGEESAFQPLSEFVLLTRTKETLPLLSVGGGVSVRVAPYAVLRFDFRDHISPFPEDVIQPAPGAKVGGYLHDFLPMVSLGFTF